MMNTAAANFQIGSFDPGELQTRFFLDTPLRYSPESIDAPPWSEPERARLAGGHFWREAASRENATSSPVAAAAALESDPAIRKALELRGGEDRRPRLLGALRALPKST